MENQICFGSKNTYQYTPYFCEENIWLLGKKLINQGIGVENLYAVFLTNKTRQIPLFNQNQVMS